ncbi:MAG: hypothetical protein M3362_15105 [Acidobacteriota bacterium]|nr:hypothetical protein [Acidobacteriota bacterium]
MSNRLRSLMALGLLLSLLFYTQTVALAQTPASNSAADPWETVKALPTGTELEVKLYGGGKLKGRLLDVYDAGLRLSRKDEITVLGRADISKVYELRPKSGEFNRLMTSTGAALGGGAGVAAGLSLLLRSPGFRGPSPAFVFFPVAGAALGGIGGHMIASRMKSHMLIYDGGQRHGVAPNGPSHSKP